MREGEPNIEHRPAKITVEHFPPVNERPDNIPPGKPWYGFSGGITVVRIQELRPDAPKPSAF